MVTKRLKKPKISKSCCRMAEVYVSGQIESADGFGDNRLCCRWTLQADYYHSHFFPAGGGWRVVEGAVEGQTQTDLPSVFDEAYFGHPIDLHFATKTIQAPLQLFLYKDPIRTLTRLLFNDDNTFAGLIIVANGCIKLFAPPPVFGVDTGGNWKM
ncbi:B9 protein [Teladorsagia circumcincta]|uniref:B9 domain-containing protein 2 n=1 Tax=Teladorsagia circumcincta TaxID=45464 RepID=A0A2G9U5W5_TELCI|nr:B9 protein [Teladorsagia circumcincta]